MTVRQEELFLENVYFNSGYCGRSRLEICTNIPGIPMSDLKTDTIELIWDELND